MRLQLSQRKPGEIPIGALLMLPLFGLPLGAYLVERELVDLGTCGMKAAFDLPCLSCGSTRATLHLFHGELLSAVTLQPMMMGIYLLLIVWGAVSLWAFATRRHVGLVLSDREDMAVKLALLSIPLINWAYLILAGV